MKTFILLLMAFLTLVTGSCKKDKNGGSGQPTCRITDINSTGQHYTLTYDAEERLLSVVYNDYAVSSFTYKGSDVTTLNTQNGGDFISKVTFTINSNGLVSHSRTEYNTSGTNWTERNYEYNGTQVIKETLSRSGGSSSIRTYEWSNGNMIKESIAESDGSSTQSLTYEYYLDKSYQPGDVRSWDKLLKGTETIRSKNLVKKLTNVYTENNIPDTEVINYSYSFDNIGKIISMTGSDGITYKYQYRCD